MIPKEWEGSNFYEDLGVARGASQQEIRRGFRAKIRQYHPDIYDQNDHSEQFQRISIAYQVLRDPYKRSLYDSYLFPDALAPREKRIKDTFQGKTGTLLFRTAIFILLLFLVSHQGFFVNQTTHSNTGGANSSASQIPKGPGNQNQVLELMVGPQGPPGPAGVAGKNGFIGLNGYQGKDGLPGAPGISGAQGTQGLAGPAGPAGPAGAAGASGIQGLQGLAGHSVTITSASVDQCSAGGYVLNGIDATGTAVSVPVCNGTGGGGGGGILGSGYADVGACDSSVHISLQTTFTVTFLMNSITLDQLDGACNGQTLTTTLKIKSAPIDDTSGAYQAGDIYICTKSLSLTASSANNSVTLTSSDCVNQRTNAHNFNSVLASDVASDSRALQLQIA